VLNLHNKNSNCFYFFFNLTDGVVIPTTTTTPVTTRTTTRAPTTTTSISTTMFDQCIAKPCLNNGLCSSSAMSFTCTCQPGFFGTRCEIRQSKCDSVTCLNYGVCIESTGTCLCQPGFTDTE
jgi:hypothetical protein